MNVFPWQHADSKAFGYDMGRLFGHSSRFSSSESTCEVRTSDIFICRSDKVIVRFQMGWPLIPIRNHFEISILKYCFWVVDMSIVAFQECCKSLAFWNCSSPQVWVDLHRWWTQLRCGHPWFEEFRSVGESEEQCPAFRRHISRWCSSSMGRNAWHGLCWRVFSLAHHFNRFQLL